MARISVKINQRSLIADLKASDPVLKRVADEVMERSFFTPAVTAMQSDFERHRITQEIAGGLGSDNVSQTLEAPFREDDEKGDTVANLWGFLGFQGSPGEALIPIRQRLDPRHPQGPKMVYRGRDKDQLHYRYEIRAPDEDAIYNDTPLPWLERGGPSWVKRIEQGVPGIGHFLNVSGRPTSRSGGGIQVEGKLRSGRYRPTRYFSEILNNFLRRATGRTPNGRAGV